MDADYGRSKIFELEICSIYWVNIFLKIALLEN